MPFAARTTDQVSHPLPPVLGPGPGSTNVIIGKRPAWRALPAAVGSAIEAAGQAMSSMSNAPLMTPVDATAQLAAIQTGMTNLAGVAAASGSPGSVATSSSAITSLTATNVALTTTWTAASAVPGGQPAANQAYTEGIKAATITAMSSLFSSMSGLADMHVCTTPLPIPPHGPGFVVKGSSTVFVNGLPLARQGDKVVEAAGPVNPIVLGCPTVNVGG